MGPDPSFFENLWVGLQRRWRQSLAASLATAGAIWLIIEICGAAWPKLSNVLYENATAYLATVILLCVVAFLVRGFEPLSVKFKIPTTSNHLTIKYGDLFHQKDCSFIIPVNEFFDYQLGHHVSPTSTHGGFINAIYNGDGDAFKADVDLKLDPALAIPTSRPGDRFNRYPLGTVVRLSVGPNLALLVAVANTDLTTSKACTTVDRLWAALEYAYRDVRDYGGGRTFALPLIGNGRSNLNLPPQHVLRLLILSIVTFARREGIASDLVVMLPRACLEHLDLLEIKRDWG